MGLPRHIVPDVTVIRETAATLQVASPTEAPRLEPSAGLDLRVRTDALRHHMVEVRDPTRGHRLVTLIELVSPPNKRPGPDRRAYLAKQHEVLDSDANLVEIDLLRGGERLLPYAELAAFVADLCCDYVVLVNRARRRVDSWMDYTVYPVSLRDMLPCIAVPLAGDDPDVPLDLQAAFARAYAGGPYHRAVDYTAPPDPALGDADAAWASERVAAGCD